MLYTTYIKPKHCINASFDDIHDCPLFRAITEQHPHLPLQSVGGFTLTIRGNYDVTFNNEAWNKRIMCLLKSGELKQVEIKFEL